MSSFVLEPRVFFDAAAAATADATIPADNAQGIQNDGSLLNQQTEAVLEALTNIDSLQPAGDITTDTSEQLAATNSQKIFITSIADSVIDTAITDA